MTNEPPNAPWPTLASGADPLWRQTHFGRWLGLASERFDQRVLQAMAHDREAPLTLGRLAQRAQLTSAHVHLLRHLPLAGARLTDLARDARMTKQAMATAVSECERWGLVERRADLRDRRARRLVFTPLGQEWLQVYGRAVARAQAEFRAAVGEDVATVAALALEAYAAGA